MSSIPIAWLIIALWLVSVLASLAGCFMYAWGHRFGFGKFWWVVGIALSAGWLIAAFIALITLGALLF